MNTALPQNFSNFGPLVQPLANSSSASAKRDASDTDPSALAERQFARRVVSYLDDSAGKVPHDVSERLRFARELALQKARLARVAAEAASVSVSSDGSAVLGAHRGGGAGHTPGRWWMRVAALVPLFTAMA